MTEIAFNGELLIFWFVAILMNISLAKDVIGEKNNEKKAENIWGNEEK